VLPTGIAPTATSLATTPPVSLATSTTSLAPTQTLPSDFSGAIRVPEDQPTIQAGIDAAPDGGLVLVAPGTYIENIRIARKSVTLASHYHTTGDEQFIESTIIDGADRIAIIVAERAGPETKIIGFTIQNGDEGISARGTVEIRNNRFVNNRDAVGYQNGAGLNRDNIYENNRDDGIDLDRASQAVIENNIIRNNRNDGIEVRLHEYNGPTLNIIIRNNTITGNQEDGIQLIDYPDVSNRVFFIERNLIQGNAMAGLGLMDEGISDEDFRAASIPERIHLFNNTFIDNPAAVSGGDNLIALNNLFVNSTTLALKNVDGDSIAAYNLFWNNAVDQEGSNLDMKSNLFADPMLDEEFRPGPDSPAIDAGISRFEWNGETVLDLSPDMFSGDAPDLGAFEFNSR
jgi:parallel beta-helix repeat protein